MSRLLITGVSGFAAKHLAHELADRGHEVLGVGKSAQADPEIHSLLSQYFQCDITSPTELAKLPWVEMDGVINVAGIAKNGDTDFSPETYQQVNADALRLIGECILELNPRIRVVAIGSGAVYDSNEPQPQTEDSRLVTTGSPYVMSKIAMEEVAQDLRDQGLDCVVARPMNHFGPGQRGGFIVPDLYENIMLAREKNQPLMVGNLTTRRDYTDVRDIVKAYADLATADSLHFDTYNICSGVTRSGEEILQMMLEELGLRGTLEVQVDPVLFERRKNDPSELRGSYDRLHAETGWQPTIPFEQTLRDFIASTRTSL